MASGGNFERDVAKFLTVWLTGKKKPYKFWRMPGSGSLATIHEENIGLSGDIRAISPEAEWFTEIWNVECKIGYPTTSFWQHFKGNKNFNIRDFWRQCVEDAKKADKRPMLIYRKKRQPEIVGVEPSFMKNYYIAPSITMNFEPNMNILPDVIFHNMKEFFNILTPDLMKELYL